MEKLSYEIHIKILDYLCDGNQYDSQWTLICHPWRAIIQQRLFERVTVVASLTSGSSDHALQARNIVALNPMICSYIKTLKLRFESIMLWERADQAAVAARIASFFALVADICRAAGRAPEVIVDGNAELRSSKRTYALDLPDLEPAAEVTKLALRTMVASDVVLKPSAVLAICDACPRLDALELAFYPTALEPSAAYVLYADFLHTLAHLPKLTTLELDLRCCPRSGHPFESPAFQGGQGDRLGRCLRECARTLKTLRYAGPVSPELFGTSWPHMEHLTVSFEIEDPFGCSYDSRALSISLGLSQTLFSDEYYLPPSHSPSLALSYQGITNRLNDLFIAASNAATQLPSLNYFYFANLWESSSLCFHKQVGTKSLVRPKMKAGVSPKYTLQFRHEFRPSLKILKIWRKRFGDELHIYEAK